ncbi:DUF1385 domain-containing protein [Psychroflexus sp. MES1-P1E]|uniref:DUF1385 domain-containing protein n=1 Tax=Psychroflexus sp. MES1-P1E TaxID=2058320 RepID=UPI000C7DEA78|nr:DUF1385 domain-containing protein [Psychroflexus sp. MES1-P1E]PKG42814.1 hypothetical protein CXF67_08285 [Psychroflexus sp. MES1-P1E]
MKKSIEYIANKSKELLSTQIDSYRSLHQKAGTVIAVGALFAPLFLFLVEKAELWVRITASILITPLIAGIILLLLTLTAKKLNQGYDESNFENLINQDIDEVQKIEIAYNKYSIEKNEKILTNQNKKYNWGIGLIIIAIILSIFLLILDTSIKNNSSHNKQNNTMAKDNKKTKTSSKTDSVKIVTLPKVDPKKVIQLNEGVDPKKETRKDKK